MRTPATFAIAALLASACSPGDSIEQRSLAASDLPMLSSYPELVKQLEKLEKTSKGLIELDTIGQTNEGRDIYLAKVGNPNNTPVMIITQQHGNEPLTTEAALRLLKKLEGGSPQAKAIRDNLYVLVVVRVNPDGAEVFHRYNVDPTAPGRNTTNGFYTSSTPGVGWDINRYHWLDWTQSDLYQYDPVGYPQNPVPEAQAVIDTFKTYRPLWIADFHHQGRYTSEDGEDVTSSVLWPKNLAAPAAAVTLSKQLCVVMDAALSQYGYAAITLYPGGTYAGIGRNAYGIAGAGSVLVELKGGNYPQANGMIRTHAYRQMMSMLEATADGSVYGIDADLADEIPPRGTPYEEEEQEEEHSGE